jgi:hypothetical protein
MLYDFNNLKVFVRQHLGIDPDKITSNFKPIIEKLTQKQLDESIKIDADDIIFTDKKGNKHKGFLYIESGYSQRTIEMSGTRLPKFHILNCRTIQVQRRKKNFNGHYVFSTEVIIMKEVDDTDKELSLCGNCHKLHPETVIGMNTTEFRNKFILNDSVLGEFSDSELPKNVFTNFWGYTPDWSNTSKNYRMKKKFTCEDCGINLNQNFVNGYYLETHHIDGNPKNNDEDNFKCLCVLCHASVDKFHQENYSKGSSRRKLIDFIKLFEDELWRVGNKHLNRYKQL